MVKMSRRMANNEFKSQIDGAAPTKKRRKNNANANNVNAANATASMLIRNLNFE